jgi:protease IV
MKRVVQVLFILILMLFVGSLLVGLGGMIALFNPPEESVSKKSLLAIDLEGVIIDGKDFLELLRKYRKDDSIKGVLIRIDSPGGVVGPSQEIYDEIKRTREEFKKPVIAYCGSLAASGAYYAAVAADKIVTTPGCMVGSIGVIMNFANLEKLYDWAKIQRYSITTGKFKDAGADYKAMTAEERALFQDLLNDVLAQFKDAVKDGRKMKAEVLDRYADGRVFTGRQAVKLGFADEVGSWDDARKMLGKMTGLGDDPEIFKAKKHRGFFDYIEEASGESRFNKWAEQFVGAKLNARPLFLLPGATSL